MKPEDKLLMAKASDTAYLGVFISSHTCTGALEVNNLKIRGEGVPVSPSLTS